MALPVALPKHFQLQKVRVMIYWEVVNRGVYILKSFEVSKNDFNNCLIAKIDVDTSEVLLRVEKMKEQFVDTSPAS